MPRILSFESAETPETIHLRHAYKAYLHKVDNRYPNLDVSSFPKKNISGNWTTAVALWFQYLRKLRCLSDVGGRMQ